MVPRLARESDMSERMTALTTARDTWGEGVSCLNHSDSALWPKIREIAAQEDSSVIESLLCRFQPAPAEKDKSLLALYESRAKYDAERRTIGKPAKMLKRIIPDLTEAEANQFAIWWKDSYLDSGLSLVVGESRDDFKSIYTTAHIPGDVIYTSGIKCLAVSCMRYSFDNLPAHPTEAYASGHFRIVAVKNAEGKIGARVIVRPENKTRAPIYASFNPAKDMLESWLTENKYAPTDDGFYGAELLRIEHDDSVIVPYLDICRNADITDDSIVLRRRGDKTLNETSGVLSISELDSACDECGDGMNSDDSIYVESESICICESCFQNRFFICDGNGNVYRDSESCDVWEIIGGREVTTRETYSNAYVTEDSDFVFCEQRQEWWIPDEVVFSESESEYFPFCDIDSVIFQSDNDGAYYLIGERVELDNGQFWTVDQVTQSEFYRLERILVKEKTRHMNDGTCVDISEYMLRAILRDGYEYNSNGEIEKHQLELPFAA
jgi:hypothetical protein